MLCVVRETFRDDDMLPVYRRLQSVGRGLPERLRRIASRVEPDFARCFQPMETDDLRTLQQRVLGWCGLGVRFEIVPVLPGASTCAVVQPALDAGGG